STEAGSVVLLAPQSLRLEGSVYDSPDLCAKLMRPHSRCYERRQPRQRLEGSPSNIRILQSLFNSCYSLRKHRSGYGRIPSKDITARCNSFDARWYSRSHFNRSDDSSLLAACRRIDFTSSRSRT